MQFAERWIGSSMIVAGALAAAATLLVPGGSHHRHHHRHHAHADLVPHGCHEDRLQVPAPEPPPPPKVDPQPDQYSAVLEHAMPELERCVRGHDKIQLLVKIAPDGLVRSVSSRPDHNTPASECMERVLVHLRFPPTSEDAVIRVALPFTTP